MRETWGRPELHEDWPPIEDEVGKAGLRVLFGFWFGVVAIAGGFWTVFDVSAFIG